MSRATCKTCGGSPTSHVPTPLDADGIGHPDHTVKSRGQRDKAATKAYCLSIKDDDDQGQQIVFAENASQAKAKIDTNQFVWDRWVDIQAHRYKRYDGFSRLTKAELALQQWKDGWRWFEVDYPNPDTATDKEFLSWYETNFGVPPNRGEGQ